MREYRIDLAKRLVEMSWRRFMVLLRGLSPNSATITRLSAQKYIGKKREEEVLVEGTPEEVDKVFDRMFNPNPKVKQ